jgi:hypothetical protein
MPLSARKTAVWIPALAERHSGLYYAVPPTPRTSAGARARPAAYPRRPGRRRGRWPDRLVRRARGAVAQHDHTPARQLAGESDLAGQGRRDHLAGPAGEVRAPMAGAEVGARRVERLHDAPVQGESGQTPVPRGSVSPSPAMTGRQASRSGGWG